MLPLSLESSAEGDKPVQFVISDAIFLLLPILLLRPIRNRSKLGRNLILASVFAFLMMVIWGVIGMISQHGSLYPMLSSLRLSKPFLLVPIGAVLADSIALSKIARRYHLGAIVVLGSVFASDILFNPRFPSGRWGGNLFGLDVFGFPNSSVLFLVCLSILAAPDPADRWRIRLLSIFVAILNPFWVVFSLSRNGAVSLLIAWASSSTWDAIRNPDNRLFQLLKLSLAIGLCLLFIFATDLSEVLPLGSLSRRIERTISYSDPTSGRAELWRETLLMVRDKPILGYFFEPFSQQGFKYSTPHSQYLEIAYKTGLLGSIAFFLPFAIMFLLLGKLKAENESVQYFLFRVRVILVVISVSNFFQPNLSYSVSANFICLLAGVLTQSELALSESSTVNRRISTNEV